MQFPAHHITLTSPPSFQVADGICQHIDVKEDGKINAFSLGKSLWIDNEEFEDLDEIIARHINPMAAHARDILGFKYYRDTDGGSRDKAKSLLAEEKLAHPGKIHYFLSSAKDLPGKFMLSYMPRSNARHEYVTVTPDGFRFRRQSFDSLSALLKWFKEHFRDAIPGGTPVTPGGGAGRLTSRTPYNMTGTPGGAVITPGAMSLATGTPYGTTPGGTYAAAVNTPYTPSGQTPFMTPYGTPGNAAAATPRHTPRMQAAAAAAAMAYGRAAAAAAVGGLTPGGSRQPPLPRQNMPPPPTGGYTPGRNTPGGGASRGQGGPAPYPSPSPYGSTPSGYRQSPAAAGGGTPRGGGGREPSDWQAAADAWARGARHRASASASASGGGGGNVTPRGYTGSTTPRYDDNNPRSTPGGGGQRKSGSGSRTPKEGGKRTPRAFADATPLYDE